MEIIIQQKTYELSSEQTIGTGHTAIHSSYYLPERPVPYHPFFLESLHIPNQKTPAGFPRRCQNPFPFSFSLSLLHRLKPFPQHLVSVADKHKRLRVHPMNDTLQPSQLLSTDHA